MPLRVGHGGTIFGMGSSTRVLQIKKIRYSPIHYVGSGVSTLKEAYSKWECLPFWNLVHGIIHNL